ncbi:MAG: TrbG/VirB9 family P-type conjugative transfer protein [Thermoanaerobaculia bacterium]
MRKRLLTITTMGMALGAALHAQPSQVGVREVAASDRGVISLATKIRYTTMVILPDGEEILDVLCGDKEFWIINASHNIAHVKPAKEGAATNLNLVTSSGTVYSFLLAESKGAPDLKVYVTADPDAARKQAKYYSAKDVSELQMALTDARVAVETVQHRSDETLADFKKSYPSTLQFAYTMPAYSKPFLVKSIWHDDRYTYIKADARELPTLYEVTGDGAPSLVNFQVQNGTYVVPKVLERGYLALGTQKLAFQTRDTKGR